MSDIAYVVMGECGEHSDYRTWVAGVFDTREDAEQYAKAAEDHLKALLAKHKGRAWDVWGDHQFTTLDSRAAVCSWEDTYYSVIEVPRNHWPLKVTR